MMLARHLRPLVARRVALCTPRRVPVSTAAAAVSEVETDAPPQPPAPPLTAATIAELERSRDALEEAQPADQGASGARRLPVNYAPEGTYTVDSPAEEDAKRFKLDPSVALWRTYRAQWGESTSGGGGERGRSAALALQELQTLVSELLATSALRDAESAAYWAYHLGRTSFFIGASALAAFAQHAAVRWAGAVGGGAGGASGEGSTVLENVSRNLSREVVNRLHEGVAMYQQDLEAIKAGEYKLPWDMTTISHRQYNPLFAATSSLRFLDTAVGTLNRRRSEAPTANWFASNMYPDYFMANTFHYQEDGWLSKRSADAYEFSTEALFFGRQDAMQRSALRPIAAWLREQAAEGRAPGDVRLLEVACGTGRFHTFVKDNYPTMRTVASDLSPYYLERARANMAYWGSQRAPDGQLAGGARAAGTEFMQCAAEAVPAPDSSFDIVVCVYLMHEQPESARAAVAREMHRLLRPGGLAVVVDSVQLGDRVQWDARLGAFGSMNEPHFRSYIACDLGAMFEDAGFACGGKWVASASKTLSFVKPSVPAASTAAASNGTHGSTDAARPPEASAAEVRDAASS